MYNIKWINCRYNSEDKELISKFIADNADVKQEIFQDELLNDDIFIAMIEQDSTEEEHIIGICSLIELYNSHADSDNIGICDFYITEKYRNNYDKLYYFIHEIINLGKYHCQNNCIFVTETKVLEENKYLIQALRCNHFRLETNGTFSEQMFSRRMPVITE